MASVMDLRLKQRAVIDFLTADVPRFKQYTERLV